MADFCTNCAQEMFGTPGEFDPTIIPDIDVQKIFDEIKPGFYMPVICKGCAMVAIVKKPEDPNTIYISKLENPDVFEKYVPMTKENCKQLLEKKK